VNTLPRYINNKAIKINDGFIDGSEICRYKKAPVKQRLIYTIWRRESDSIAYVSLLTAPKHLIYNVLSSLPDVQFIVKG